MKKLLKIFILTLLINNLYADSKVLYPVYSIRLDKININMMWKIQIEKEQMVIKYKMQPTKGLYMAPPPVYHYMVNLNNLLLFQKINNSDYNYNLLGRIIIDKNNNVEYEALENSIKNRDIYEAVEKKQSELRENIDYINHNKFTLEEIKKILDVDFINEDLGEKLYSNKQDSLSVEEATKNLINCRFCEQMIDVYSKRNGCKKYSICDDSNYYESWDYSIIYAIIHDDKFFDDVYPNSDKNLSNFFKKLNEKGNIYNQLNSEYISYSYKEWQEKVKGEAK